MQRDQKNAQKPEMVLNNTKLRADSLEMGKKKLQSELRALQNRLESATGEVIAAAANSTRTGTSTVTLK